MKDKLRSRQRLRRQVFEAYGGLKCIRCGFDDPRALVLDHIDDDGGYQRKELGIEGGVKFYIWLRRNDFPPGLQVLCANCNLIKQYPDVDRFGAELEEGYEYRKPGSAEFCANGHPRDESNIAYTKEGHLRCRQCSRDNSQNYRERHGFLVGSRPRKFSDSDVEVIKEISFNEAVERFDISRSYYYKIKNGIVRS